MSEVLKLKYKVGEIEFEAEGPAEAVEQQRVNFMNAVLPAAVNAMVKTRTASDNREYIDAHSQQNLLSSGVEEITIPSKKDEHANCNSKLQQFSKL